MGPLLLLLLSLHLHLSSSCLAPPPPPPPPITTSAPTTIISSSCKCGERKVDRTRIVGGQNVVKNEYPWQVGLVRRGSSSPFCGGTLVSSTTVVTAAHCATDVSQFQVVVGDHDITRNDGEVRVNPATWNSHPDYNSRTQDHDIAIIQLAQPVQFSSSVAPACLPSSSSNSYAGQTAVATGWGTLSSGGSRPSILQEVDLTVQTNQECTAGTYSSSDITASMVCATGPGKDSCQGDSGGPLVSLRAGAYDLVGVVSWGYGCAQAGAPGVYSRLTDQLAWVTGQLGGTTCPRA